MPQFASFSDVKLDPRIGQETAAPDEGEFSKGLRGGLADIGGKLNSFAASGAKAVGADDFAAGREAASLRGQQEAEQAQASLRNPDWASVHDLRGGANWLAGQAGQLAPSLVGGVGAGIAGGIVGGPVGAIAAPTALFAPIEAGSVHQGAQNDPTAPQRTPVEQFGRELGFGTLSSGVQNILPGAVGGKLIGRAGEAAVAGATKRTIGQSLAHNFVGDAVGQGAAAGGADLIRQEGVNPNKTFDMHQAGESALGGAVMGGALGGVGFAGDMIHGLPRKAIGGAKDLAIGAKDAVLGAPGAAKEAVSGAVAEHPSVKAAWDGASGMASAVFEASKTKFDESAPQTVKDGVAWAKSSLSDTSAEARTWARELMESDSVPTEIKDQIVELRKNLGNRSNRVGIWALKQAQNAATSAKETLFGKTDNAPDGATDAVARVREAMAPKDDTLDRIINGTPLGDVEAIAKSTDSGLINQAGEKAASFISKTYESLLKRADLSPENQQKLAEMGTDFTDQATRAKVAVVANSMKIKDTASRKLNALWSGLKKGMDATQKTGPEKKSEDFSGIRSVIEETVAPMLADSHPELMADPEMRTKLADSIRMFIAAASSGDNESLMAHTNEFSKLLGADTAHNLLSDVYRSVEGNSPAEAAAAEKFFSTIVSSREGQAKSSSAHASLAEVIDAQDKAGKGPDSQKLAESLMGFARGDNDNSASPAERQNNILSIRQGLVKQYGERGAGKIWAAVEKNDKANRPKMSRGRDDVIDENSDGTDSGGFADDASGSEYGTTTEKEAGSFYVGKGANNRFEASDGNEMPKLYGNPALHPKGSKFAHAVSQAIDKINTEDASARAHFVPLRAYGKARGWTEAYMTQLAGGDNPSNHGFIKGEKMDAAGGLEAWQLRTMRMGNDFKQRKNADGRMEYSPDAILAKVKGRETPDVLDSRKIAGAMHKAAKDEWSDGDNANGWATRLATKFAEGMSALMDHYGTKIDVRDDQVIGKANGQDLTWAEAQQLIKNRKTVPEDKGTLGERRVRETIPELNDMELRSYALKVHDSVVLKETEARALLREQILEEGKTVTYAAVSARLKEYRKTDESGLPPLDRIARALSSEKDKRSGESNRELVMDTGMETREGYTDLGKVNRRVDASVGVDKTSKSDRRVGSMIDDFLGIGKGAKRETAEKTRASEATVKEAIGRDKLRQRSVITAKRREAEIKAGVKVADRDAPFDKGRSTLGSGRTEGDPNGNIHDAAALLSENDLIHQNPGLGGKSDPLTVNNTKAIADLAKRLATDSVMTPVRAKQLRSTIAALSEEQGMITPAGQQVLDQKIARLSGSAVKSVRELGAQAKELGGRVKDMDVVDRSRYNSLIYLRGISKGDEAGMRGITPKQAADIITDLYAKYPATKVERALTATKDIAEPVGKPAPAPNKLDAMLAKDDYSNLDTTEKADQFMRAAKNRFENLKGVDEDLTADQNKALATLYSMFGKDSTADLASYYPGGDTVDDFGKSMGRSDKQIRAMLAEGPPSPKVQAAKKAALLEKAASGDKGLVNELATSNDAKGLQRAAEALSGLRVNHVSPNEFSSLDFSRLGESFGLITAGNAKRSGGGIFTSTNAGLLKDYKALVAEKFGRVFEYGIDLNVRPDEILDLTKRLNEQPAAVFSKLDGILNTTAPEGSAPSSAWHGLLTSTTIKALSDRLRDPTMVRETLIDAGFKVTHFAEPDSAGELRGGNYVVLDPNAVTAMHRVGTESALDAANTRLDQLVQDPEVAYGLQTKKHSLEGAQESAVKAGVNPMTAKAKAQVVKIAETLFGKGTKVDFANIPHAGEYLNGLMTVSVHALNPNSVLYHESLHKLFDMLDKSGNKDVAGVLEKAASTPAVMAKLREHLKNEPDALRQLNNPEERAAYMFQYWASGDLKVGEKATTLFGKIAAAIRKVMGIWTNDERALKIMEHFTSGELAGKGKPAMNAVSRSLMEGGRNKSFEALHGMAKPFMDLAEGVVGAGSANLRDTGNFQLAKLADLVKKKNTAEGEDAGYLPATRIAKADFINKYTTILGTATKDQIQDALEGLQNNTKASSPEARILQKGVRGLLDELHGYMTTAGVSVGDLGLGKDYFPRQWDPHFMSKNKDAFLDMARKYPKWGDPEGSYNKMVANNGSELQVVDKPGMSALSKRVLSFVSHADAAPFMSKDMHRIMDSYITQATRRGEWSRRFGADNEKLTALYDAASKEGATPKQIDRAKEFVAGVNGTLGDDLNPVARRAMGNMIVYQNIRLLPLAVFSMAVDPNGVMVRGGTIKDAWNTLKRGIKEIPMGLKGMVNPDEQTSFAAEMGVIDNAVLQHAIGSMYTQGVTGNTARKLNDTFFKYNLVEQMNTSMRVGATEAGMGFLARHGDGKLNAHSMRYLAELGLKPADIIKDADGRVKTRVSDGLSEAHAAKMKSALNQWVDGAVLRPDAADKPTWMNDPHFMLFSHLKQFTYAFQHTILARVMHEAKHGNYTPAMALSSYVPMMLAADLVKGMIQGGGDQPEWKKGWGIEDYASNATQRAGLFGVGQIGVDVMKNIHEGGTGIGQLAGPTVEQFGEAVQMLGGHRRFGTMALHSLPANQLYLHAFNETTPDPTFAE